MRAPPPQPNPAPFDRCGRAANPFRRAARDRWGKHSDTTRNARTGRDRFAAVYRVRLRNAMTSDAAVQSAAVQETVRVEHFLDLLHHRKIISWPRPQLGTLAEIPM